MVDNKDSAVDDPSDGNHRHNVTSSNHRDGVAEGDAISLSPQRVEVFN